MICKRSVGACLAMAIAAGGFVVAPTAAHAQAASQNTSLEVYFDEDSEEIGAVAGAILDNVATTYKVKKSGAIVLRGHADATVGAEGYRDYGRFLSQLRVENVRTQLVARGVPEGVITVVTVGASRPAQEGLVGARNRRVEIIFGPGSGW